jgi:hypothetical protein
MRQLNGVSTALATPDYGIGGAKNWAKWAISSEANQGAVAGKLGPRPP